MHETRQILIEGLPADEIMALPDAELETLVMTDVPIVFTVGSAELLGKFRVESAKLVVELGHIDGGGEGVLPLLWRLSECYARRRGLEQIEWIVHALTCESPNLKLQRILERRGFEAKEISGSGLVYWLLHPLPPA